MSFHSIQAAAVFQEGLAHHRSGDYINAVNAYQQVIALESQHAGAWHFQGVIALSQGNVDHAIELMERSIRISDNKASYFNNYGSALLLAERFFDARAAFEKALELRPHYPDAYANLASVLLKLHENSELIEGAIQCALRDNPTHFEAKRNLAELRIRENRNREAAEIFLELDLSRDAIREFAKNDCHDEALDLLELKLKNSPKSAELLHWKGILLGESGQIQKSKVTFRMAVSSGGASIWKWKHLWYCPVYFENAGQIDEYWNNLNAELDKAIDENNIYDWRTLPELGFTSSFHLPHHYRSCHEIKEKFVKLFEPSFPFEPPKPRSNIERIRIGFLLTPGHEGGFIRNTKGLIERLDRNRFEICLIYEKRSSGYFREFEEHEGLKHITFGNSFEETVDIVQRSNCDILYYWKVGADTWNFFLPMMRLAPVQFTSWGTHGTSGLKHVDYYLSFAGEIDSARDHYTEKLYKCEHAPNFQSKIRLSDTASRSDFGLPEDGAIYFSPHRLSKYHPDFDLYMKGILENDPNGNIVVLLRKFSPIADKFRQRIRKNLGEKLFQRVRILPTLPLKKYYQLLSISDLVLDSPVYSGGITSYDSFSFGVPCVTFCGPLMVQRFTTAMYNAMGITGPMISGTSEEYVSSAVKLGLDADFRDSISEQIHEKNDAVFEQGHVIMEFEQFLEKVVVSEK